MAAVAWLTRWMTTKRTIFLCLGFVFIMTVLGAFISTVSLVSTRNISPHSGQASWSRQAGDSYFKITSRKHLSPFASITQRLSHADPPLNRTQINELYQSGAGLTKISLEGVDIWQEYGVSYIPHNMSRSIKSNLADVYSSGFEPYIPYNHTAFFEGRKHVKVPDSSRKIILAPLAGMDDINGVQPLRVCPEFPCLLATNFNTYFQQASAVTFNGILLKGKAPARLPHQVFIFYNYEPLDPTWGTRSVIHSKKYHWADAFNWTMSFHVDADIFMPYGLVRKQLTPVHKDYPSILAQKVKLAAVIVSHCQTFGKREEYIRELQRYVSIDVYGACGPFKCQRENDLECITRVSREYKFYLAFESCLCEDYITEKFFKNLNADIVLVARGGADYYRQVPDNIYVDAANFESPKALAARLKYLDQHDQEYLDILRNKDQYFVTYENYPHVLGKTTWVKYNWENVPLCEVCQRLWNVDLYAQTYPDIGKWFSDRYCREPTDV